MHARAARAGEKKPRDLGGACGSCLVGHCALAHAQLERVQYTLLSWLRMCAHNLRGEKAGWVGSALLRLQRRRRRRRRQR